MRLPNNKEFGVLTAGVLYPLGDRLSEEEKDGFGLPSPGLEVGAMKVGQFRAIRPGEWYFSGADIAAYKAPNGTTDPYHVAYLVSYRLKTTVKPERVA